MTSHRFINFVGNILTNLVFACFKLLTELIELDKNLNIVSDLRLESEIQISRKKLNKHYNSLRVF